MPYHVEGLSGVQERDIQGFLICCRLVGCFCQKYRCRCGRCTFSESELKLTLVLQYSWVESGYDEFF
jgi:hypothetical protein